MGLIIPKIATRKLVRLFLRIIPIIPAPELYDIFKDLKQSKVNISDKIEKTYQSLKEASDLIEELQSDLTEQVKNINDLKEQYERYSKLADIEEAKVRALLMQIEKTVSKGKNVERWVSFLINIIAGILLFLLGIWLGPKI